MRIPFTTVGRQPSEITPRRGDNAVDMSVSARFSGLVFQLPTRDGKGILVSRR
jgi:hypothetical protein